MAIIPVTIAGPLNKGRGSSNDAQETINLIHNVDNSGGKAILSMMDRPCLELFANVGSSPIRGQMTIGVWLYIVSGYSFIRMANNGTYEAIGTLLTNSGRIGMATNGIEIMIVDGTAGYTWTLVSEVFDQISDNDFGGADDVTYVDGYFIINIPNSGVAQSSALYHAADDDGGGWNALDKATIEGDPDKLVKAIAVHRDVWMLGEFTSEVYYNAGLPYGFPFQRYQGGFMETGLAARWGAVVADNTLYWLAQNKQGFVGIVLANGYSPQKISTPAIDYQINQMISISDCIAFAYSDEGHTFVFFTFPIGKKTFVYDISIGLWSEWKSYGKDYFRAAFHCFYNNAHMLGDLTTGNIYKIKFGRYTDNGDVMIRSRTAAHLQANGVDITINKVWIDLEMGVGKTSGQGSDPQIMLQWSKDGGKTWGNEQSKSIGKKGAYGSRATWTRQGTSKLWTPKITFSDPVPFILNGFFCDIEYGSEL